MRRATAAAALLTAIVLSVLGPPATAAAESPGHDVAGCLDGNCTLRVTGPVKIPLDGRAGPIGLSVSSIGPFAVAFWVHRRRAGCGGPRRLRPVQLGSGLARRARARTRQ